jgi:hypothetical protein
MVVLAPRAPASVAVDSVVVAVEYGVGIALMAAQFVVLLILVGLIGYPMFSSGWVGTIDDINKVVLWAFAIDLSVAGVRQLTSSRTA